MKAIGPAIARGLGFDLQAAVRTGSVRFIAIHTVDGGLLPADLEIPVRPGEVVVACAALDAPLCGLAALIVRAGVLTTPGAEEQRSGELAAIQRIGRGHGAPTDSTADQVGKLQLRAHAVVVHALAELLLLLDARDEKA